MGRGEEELEKETSTSVDAVGSGLGREGMMRWSAGGSVFVVQSRRENEACQ